MTKVTDPQAPCGYCRRCAIHDDPGGCTTVSAWEATHPAEAAAGWRAAGASEEDVARWAADLAEWWEAVKDLPGD